MDWIFKAALTAGTVLLVTVAARHFGQRAAGVVAALPIITAPTLAWVSQEQGVRFAVSAAVGSVSACAILAIFALAYARGSRHGGALTASACGLAGALSIALPAAAVSARLDEALALALACCSIAFLALPASGKHVSGKHVSGKRDADKQAAREPVSGEQFAGEHFGDKRLAPSRRSHLAPMAVSAVAGGLTAVAATIGPDLGGFATGLLSSLPLIGGGVAILEHATSGPRAAQNFLHGYVRGLFGKTAFGAVFALLAAHVGAPAALAVGVATACMLSCEWERPRPDVLRQRH